MRGGDPPLPALKDEAPLDEQSRALYCLGTEVLNAIGHAEHPQDKMSDAEGSTTGWVAMRFLRGNVEAARTLLRMPPYIPPLLSRSRVHRRLPRLKHLFLTLADRVGYTWKQLHPDAV